MKPQPTGTYALSRTFQTIHTIELDRVVVKVYTHEVTLSRAWVGAPISATVDGEDVDYQRALEILDDAHAVKVLTQIPAPDDQTPIGKTRAHLLHRLMGSLGLKHPQHYAVAAAALGEWQPLPSLSTLSRREARTVWKHLESLYPQAREVAAKVNPYWQPGRSAQRAQTGRNAA